MKTRAGGADRIAFYLLGGLCLLGVISKHYDTSADQDIDLALSYTEKAWGKFEALFQRTRSGR